MQSMHSHLLRVAAVGLSVCLTVTHVWAATVWNEIVNGDLSGNGNSPTSPNLLAGENLVIATMPGGTTLSNDPTPGTVDESEFKYWRNNFGDVFGSGEGVASAVPEPAPPRWCVVPPSGSCCRGA